MKSTIDIPDGLAAAAKSRARQDGTTLRELVVTGLRAELERRERRTRTDFVFPTFAGEGLLVDPQSAIELSYGLDVDA